MATVAGNYKSGDKINLVYQAIGGLSSAAPVCKIYDEANASDTAKQSVLNSALLANEKAGGRYLGYFTPDAEGRWTVCIQDKNGDGLVSKTYEVCGHSVDSIGDDVSDVKSAAVVAGNASSSALAAASSALNQAKSAVAAASDVKSAVIAQSSDVKSAVTVAGNKATSALAAAASALGKATSAAAYASAAAAGNSGSPAMVS